MTSPDDKLETKYKDEMTRFANLFDNTHFCRFDQCEHTQRAQQTNEKVYLYQKRAHSLPHKKAYPSSPSSERSANILKCIEIALEGDENGLVSIESFAEARNKDLEPIIEIGYYNNFYITVPGKAKFLCTHASTAYFRFP